MKSFMLLLLFPFTTYAAPNLMLAKEYVHQDIRGWVMSEKLDGVRAYWDGKQLLSRQGTIFTPPSDFTQNFPPYPLDGELFSTRGQFEQISATVRSKQGDWSKIKLYVFDVPKEKGNLYERLAVLEDYLKKHPANIMIIKQYPVQNIEQAKQEMARIVKLGGEGIILRNPNLSYSAGRSDGYLKLKPLYDAECVVTKHHEGKGKYTGKMGALSCRNHLGEFKIGSGFKDADRISPPPIGSIITYRYRGLTQKGLPRFATFLRVRSDK